MGSFAPKSTVVSVLARLAWAVSCLLLLVSTAMASTSPLRFKRLTNLVTDDMSVVSMLQDRKGFIWIATLNGGLYRYDGYQAVRYGNEPGNLRSLPSDRTGVLFEDPESRIWVATREGLARFNRETNDFTRYTPLPAPGSPLLVKNIVSDGAGGMWLATWAGLQHFYPATGKFDQHVHQERVPGSLAGNNVDAMALDRHGGLWVATWPAGIDYLPRGSRTFRHFRLDSPAAPNPVINIVHALHLDQQQRLWIGTGSGVYRWSEAMAWSRPERVPSPDTRVNSFYADQKGTLWSGTMTGGLLRWTAGSDEVFVFSHRASDPYSVPPASIASVMRDRTGNLWIGTYNSGVSVASTSSGGFARLIPPPANPENPQPVTTHNAIERAPGGRVWLGSLSGFILLDPASGAMVRQYRAQPGKPGALQSDTVYSFLQQPGGTVWVGTAAGLHRLDRPDGAFKVYSFGEKADNFINTIVPGANGMLWIGTGNSVVHFNPSSGAWKALTSAGQSSNRRLLKGASTILEDSVGRVWMGLEAGAGMDMLDTRTGRYTHFRHDDMTATRLAGDTVSALHQDASGRIWVGTAKGLNEIVTAPNGAISFRLHDAGVGQPRVFAILSEPGGAIWLSTTSSLIRYDPRTHRASRFSAVDGLIDSYRVGNAFAGDDGRLYFGGSSGATVVTPREVALQTLPPAVTITDVSVAGRSLAVGKRPEGVTLGGPVTEPRALELPPEQSVFSVDFSALHYTDANLNRYAYQLEGFDPDWIAADATHRSATYTNLAPGVYLFKVRASNDRDQWSEDAALMRVKILPPLWKTWWFRLLAAALTIAVLAGVYRIRVRSLTRTKMILEGLVAARTGELEQSNRKLAESNAKLAALSMTDGLTGVTNRRGFDMALDEEWGRASRIGEPVALLMIDVDHFKLYNDLYGHQAGDQCLRAIAQAIAGHARRTGDTAARYGGEEFVLLAPLCYGPNALSVAQGVCAAVTALNFPHEHSSCGRVSVSIGVAVLVPGVDTSADMLLLKADQALYRAKQEGRNRVLLAVQDETADGQPIPGGTV